VDQLKVIVHKLLYVSGYSSIYVTWVLIIFQVFVVSQYGGWEGRTE
jgi:hypothetical protein